jgi:NIPSNAP
MMTLCIRYAFNPEKIADFRSYVEAEHGPIARSSGKILGYYLPTDYAGPNNEALGLIDFATLSDYERYRSVLANDPDHKTNVARLLASGAGVAMSRSIIARCGQG